MDLTQDHFPVFEANQILTSGHLNDAFNRLDEQERLTRANLIGIGIVCGLEIKLDTAAATVIRLFKGCGVTSQGYLVVEPEDVSLVSYRAGYLVPKELDYPAFTFKDPDNISKQYPLWELFPEGEPNTVPLTPGFLDDKAVLLFMELKKEGLRNCSPNNCDDKGAEVTGSVKRLLVKRDDLDKIIVSANALGSDLTSSDIQAEMLARLNLPDVAMPRFDVPNTGPATSNDVYAAFLNVFRAGKLAAATESALHAAYTAFKPLLQASFPADPFGGFSTAFGFLDSAPVTTDQVRFLQYYYDFFDDLLRGYDEFRWKGAELACACCPAEGLFPRHLMLGLLFREQVSQPSVYRHDFLASAAVGACVERTKEAVQLFARLVEMIQHFDNHPSLPQANDKAATDPQIRITPSVLGGELLSCKAIPYYYEENGTPPLYQLWSHEKTRRNRANRNLSYRYDEYTPAAPAQVSDPLRYDLEPYDFLRIEGHLGKNYQKALGTLLLLKTQYRLPIDILALRTGAFDTTQAVDLSMESARFQDLEALYDALRAELLTTLTEGVMYLYSVPVAGSTQAGGTPKHPLLKTRAPNYRFPAGSVGAWYEQFLDLFLARPYIDVNQNQIDASAVLTVYCQLFAGTTGLPAQNWAHAVSIYYLTKLSEILPDSLDALGYADFENKYQDLVGLVRFFRSEAVAQIPNTLTEFVPKEDLVDHFDEVLFSCKLDPIKSVHDEYARRLSQLKTKQFLGPFLASHPGAQHKAGVALGGTFLLVYHQDPAPPRFTVSGTTINVAPGLRDALLGTGGALAEGAPLATASASAGPGPLTLLSDSAAPAPAAAAAPAAAPAPAPMFLLAPSPGASGGQTLGTVNVGLQDIVARLGANRAFAADAGLVQVLTSLVQLAPVTFRPVFRDAASRIIASTVGELVDGTVIADFYLPYLISPDTTAVQFVLPSPQPTFNAKVGSTSSDGTAPVAITPAGGLPPYEIKVDAQDYRALEGPVFLAPGPHTLTILDIEGVESASQTVTVPAQLVLSAATLQCSQDFGTYTAAFTISGGTPPYVADGTAITGNAYTTKPIPSGTPGSVTVLDSNQWSVKSEFTKTCVKPCDLPCSGIALRRGYRFWLPDFDANRPYETIKFETAAFSFEFPPGTTVDLSTDIKKIIDATMTPAKLNAGFTQAAKAWTAQVNKLIAVRTKKDNWLNLSYLPGQPGVLGTLLIEYLQCLKFDVQMGFAFQRKGTSDFMTIQYLPAGTTIKIGNASVKIPAFDGTKADKCNPQTPVEALCPKAPDMTLKVGIKVSGLSATATVTPSGADKPVAYLWEAQDAVPAMTNVQSPKFTFTSGGSKLVSVTAFTKAGCKVTQAQNVNVVAG